MIKYGNLAHMSELTAFVLYALLLVAAACGTMVLARRNPVHRWQYAAVWLVIALGLSAAYIFS